MEDGKSCEHQNFFVKREDVVIIGPDPKAKSADILILNLNLIKKYIIFFKTKRTQVGPILGDIVVVGITANDTVGVLEQVKIHVKLVGYEVYNYQN